MFTLAAGLSHTLTGHINIETNTVFDSIRCIYSKQRIVYQVCPYIGKQLSNCKTVLRFSKTRIICEADGL